MASHIARRKFVATLLGGAAAWPLAARAQQAALPVIGYISSLTQADSVHFDAAFRRGLSEMAMSKVRTCGSNTVG
jgi:putative ABC transport system substrate-binding protein